MKKWKLAFLLLASFFLIFAIVTIFRTATVMSKQPVPKPTQAVIDEDAAVGHLSQAVTYKTISYQDRSKFDFSEFDRFIAFLQESYPLVHQQLEYEKINDYGLVYRWKGTDPGKKPIGLTSHYDVVPVLGGTESNWEQEPFSGAVKDGKIWGRGTLDDKIGVIGLLEATEQLLKDKICPHSRHLSDVWL
ncbi:M20/M25/M40 family metallo-hydrolase [Neobacillus sp. Marseille-QA0830]